MSVSVGLYTKSLLFWIGITSLIASGVFLVDKQRPSARDGLALRQTAGNQIVRVELLENGNAKVNGKTLKNIVSPDSSADHVAIKILDGNSLAPNGLTVSVKLPKPLKIEGAKGLLIHSFDPTVRVNQPNLTTLQFQTGQLAPQAILTLQFDVAKNYLKLPFSATVSFWLSSAPFYLWLGAGLILPILTLILFAYQIIKRSSLFLSMRRAQAINKPPASLPPAVVGALFHGKITPRELVATLIDLANQKKLTVFARDDGFTFGKTKIEPNLNFERLLIAKIFYDKQQFARQGDVKFRVGHRIFSQKIAQMYLDIYRKLERQQFFNHPPSQTIFRWRKVGAVLFFVGILGFFSGVIFFPEPKFPLLLWLGVILGGAAIASLAPLMINYSKRGITALKQWLGFKKFLESPKAVSYEQAVSGVLVVHLPYAIVFGVERAWINRFRNHPFAPPSWFDSPDKVINLETFSEKLLPITGYVSRLLAQSREPVV